MIQIDQEMYVLIFRNNAYIKSLASNTTHAMDLGALTPFLGLRRERKITEFYERVSELVCSCVYRPGGLALIYL